MSDEGSLRGYSSAPAARRSSAVSSLPVTVVIISGVAQPQTRAFCPSCAANRSAVFRAFLTEEVLAEVGHWMMTFTVPRRCRKPRWWRGSAPLTLAATVFRLDVD